MASSHGSRNRYVTGGCRCDECRLAHRAYMARWKASKTPADAPQHGTHNAYSNYGCRCNDCLTAQAAYEQARKEAAA